MKLYIIPSILAAFLLLAGTSCKSSKNLNDSSYDLESLADGISEKVLVKTLGNKSLQRLLSNEPQRGDSTTKTFDVADFNAIEVSGIASIHFTQGNEFKVRAAGTPTLMEHLSVKVKDGVLTIDYTNETSHDITLNGPAFVNVYVTAPDLQKVEMEGATRFYASSISTNTMSMDISGATLLSIGRLKANSVESEISGAGNLNLSVEAETCDLECTGACKGTVSFKGGDLNLDISGAVKMNFNVDCRSVTSDNSGTSKITISGVAEKTDIENSGISRTNTKNLNKF